MIGNIIVGLVVLLSTVVVVRKLYKTLSGKSGCGCGCSCASAKNGTASCCSSGCNVKMK